MVWSLGQQMQFCDLPAAITGNAKVGQVAEVRAWKPGGRRVPG